MTHHHARLSVIGPTFLLLLLACQGAGSGEVSCDPGALLPCTCTSGASGVQTCSDGAWGDCACAESDVAEPPKDCPAGMSWVDGACRPKEIEAPDPGPEPEACVPDCVGRICGGDGCGGSCGQCGTGEFCANGTTCMLDCDKAVCGGDICCDHTCCGDECCSAGQLCIDERFCCAPHCGGKVCGDDGCGGSCGTCPAGCECRYGGCECCEDACPTEGLRECLGSAWRQCGDFDADPCLEWGDKKPCGGGGCDSATGQCVGCAEACADLACGAVMACDCGGCFGCADRCVEHACVPTEHVAAECHEGDLEWADSCGDWEGDLAEDCACGCAQGACLPAICTAGDARCNGSAREACDEDGCDWSELENCGCGCVSGACTAAVCAAGERRCAGDEVEVCEEGGCGWGALESCDCGCEAGACAEVVACAAGAERCVASVHEVCAADGCGWDAEDTCPCGCEGEACAEAACEEGALRCADGAVERCGVGGCEWALFETCEHGCEDGACQGEPPPLTCDGWTCVASWYATHDGCDCDCGCWDPDCDDPEATLYGCGVWQRCVQPGVCEDHEEPPPIACEGWLCSLHYYADGEDCDCNCGCWDPDCDDPATELYGCGYGQSCVQPGVCQDDAPPPDLCEGWTCNAAYFDDGDYCDCDCGCWDPDCDDPATSVWGCGYGQSCVQPGVCEDPEPPPPPCEGWTCNGMWYGDWGYCDCGCGCWDPDCADPDLPVFGCVLDQTCEPPGLCQD